ncbi:MAG: hypothetical protein LBV43_15525 [Prevotella sp.]|jgi:DNA gyrase/topoisomerase IV subunit B|nr:hypothetical protein [Prevotella sp.]
MRTIPIKESILSRPAMYVGSTDTKGVYRMLEAFLLDMISSAEMNEAEIEIAPKGLIRITSSDLNVKTVMKKLEILEYGFDPTDMDVLTKILDLSVILTLSGSVKIEVYNGKTYTLTGEKGEFKTDTEDNYIPHDFLIEFVPDQNIFQQPELKFEDLNTIYQRIASINPDIEIISVDNAGREHQRCVFHYPNGLADKMDSLVIQRSIDEPHIRLNIEQARGDFHYSVSFSFLNYAVSPYIQSFAGYVDTLYHGSLVDGIVKGIVKAIENYATKNGIDIEVSDKRIKEEGFILVASVLGPNYRFGGSMKLELEMPEVEEGVEEIVFNELSAYFDQDKEKADSFISRFKK